MTTESRIFKSFETFLDTSEDIAWLFETHLRAFAAFNDPVHVSRIGTLRHQPVPDPC